VLVGTNDGRLSAIDIESGDLVWQSAESPGLLGAIALSPETVVAVKGGKQAGLVAFVHDLQGSLVRVPSPTVLDLTALLGRYALAFVAVGVVLYVPLRLLRRRLGPAFAEAESEDGGETEDEEEDEGGRP
jgi:outer membrane protein assembly factor BamB